MYVWCFGHLHYFINFQSDVLHFLRWKTKYIPIPIRPKIPKFKDFEAFPKPHEFAQSKKKDRKMNFKKKRMA